MGNSVSKYHYNQAHAIIRDELLPFTWSRHAVRSPVSMDKRANLAWWLKSCVSVMVFPILIDLRDMGIKYWHPLLDSLINWLIYCFDLALSRYSAVKYGYNPESSILYLPLIITMVHFLRCAGLQASLRGLLRKHTHTHISVLHLREAFGPFPFSISHSVSEWVRFISAAVLSVFQADGEIQVWDYLWLLTRTHLRQLATRVLSLFSCFKAPYNKISHPLEQRHAAGISKMNVNDWMCYLCFICMRIEIKSW